MPKITSPLAQAMMGHNEEKGYHEMPVPRFFTFKNTELPNGAEIKPGDHFKVSVRGFVKSIDDEGNVTANIVSVMDQMPITEERDEPEMRVRTQESVTP